MPTPDMEMKGGNFTFMTKGSGNTQTETSALQAVFASHGKKSSAPNGCRHKKHASRAPSLGNISKRQDPTLLGCNSGPNQSGSDPCHGVVRPGSPHCLEPHLPLTLLSLRMGFFPLMDPAWQNWRNLWWVFLTDIPSPQEGRVFAWGGLPSDSPELMARIGVGGGTH